MQRLLFLARYRDIAADVAARSGPVIVASSGMASAIAAEGLRDSPRGAISLPLLTIETFARAIVNDAGEYPRVATEDERRIAMRTAARTLSDLLIDPQRLGTMLERSYRDVRDGGITLDELEARVRGGATLRNRRRTDAMIRAWRDYERFIAQVDAVDPADVLLRAASLIESGRVNVAPQSIAGFYDMTGAQLAIVSALARTEKLAAVLVPAGDAPDYAFATRFITALPLNAGNPAGAPPVLHIKAASTQIAQYENSFVELRETCSAIRQLIEAGTTPSSIAIVARSLAPHDLRLINRFAAENGFATSAAESIPLVAHRIGRAIVMMLRLRERSFPRADVIEVLRDGFRTSRRLSLDHMDDATRKANIAYGDSDAVRARAGDYADALAEIEHFAPATPLTGKAWSELLRLAIDRFDIETDSDAAAADAIEQIAATLARTDAWRKRFDANTVIDLFEQHQLPPSAFRLLPSVWVGDVMRFRGRTFDHVFVVRMEDDLFPQRRTEDPLLPDSDRRALKLREIGDGRDEERFLFQLLLDGASTSTHFSAAATDGVGKLIRPSRFIKQLAIAKHPEKRAGILRNFGREFARRPDNPTTRPSDNIRRQLQLFVKSGTRSEFDGYIRAGEALESRIRAALKSISPTQLEDFGECPQKFLLKHLLGVRELDEPERELHVNAKDKGSIDHQILERFYRTVTDAEVDSAASFVPQLPPVLHDRLESVIDEAFDELESTMPPFNRTMRDIERRSTKKHLKAFVADDLADLLTLDLRPREWEYAFGPKFAARGIVAAHPEPFVLQTPEVSLSIEGRIDRIDDDGKRLRVVDYKSGKAMRHTKLAEKIDRGVRMQLVLYAMAVSEFFGKDPQQISGAIKPLRGGAGARFSFDLAAHADRLRETIDLFVAAMLRGEFPAFPMETDDFNSCTYCPVNHSCRTRHNDAESYAITRTGDPRTLLGTGR